MGRFDVEKLRYLTREDFRVLTAIEMGMKNHELVPGVLIQRIAKLASGGINKLIRDLCEKRLCSYERGKQYDGYRLTNLGYDFLALKVLTSRDHISGVGTQIGVGKESDIYLVRNSDEETLCMKLHRLGRTSFRKLKEKRDYLCHRNNASWIYLSRLSAAKEFAFMQALYSYGFPVPKPVAQNRHIVIMSLVKGYPLNQITEVEDVGGLYSDLMELIVRLAAHGVIHSDFNEFNIMVGDDAKPILIDFPQMISISHTNAEWYFNRDVNCVRDFFRRRFGFDGEEYPTWEENVRREFNLDQEVMASGFSKDVQTFDAECGVGEKQEEGEKDLEEGEGEGESEGEEGREELEFDEREEIAAEQDENNEAEMREENVVVNGMENLVREKVESSEAESRERNDVLVDICDNSEVLNMQEEMENLGLKDLEVESKPIRVLTKREMRKAYKNKDSDAKSFKSNQSRLSEADQQMFKGVLLNLQKERLLARERGEKEPDLIDAISKIEFEDGTRFSMRTSITRNDLEAAKKKLAHERILKEKEKHKKLKKEIKGDANSVRRKKKENKNVIKQYSGWEDF
ncbi:UNVERIFIED_CONTAM: hypothetical protein RMT77_003978 [Armadillidium vulgare]